jgi:hypothetical protein
MPMFFAGSSEQTIKPPIPSAVVDKLAELATDEPLPDSYPGDRIRLFAQSPRRLYVYWGLERDPFATLNRAFGPGAQGYSLVVRLENSDTGEQFLHLASPNKSQWLDVQPDNSYRVDLGLYAAGRSFIRLVSSNVAGTPRSGVARTADTTPAWNVTSQQFARVLDEAGYASDALEVTLEAADAITNDAITRSVAGAFSASEVPMMTEEHLAEMRRLLAALAFGAPSDNMQSALSPLLADWLSRANAGTAMISSERLVEILHNMLGVVMSRLPVDSTSEEAMRRTMRSIVGASEINFPDRPFHLWMPSMNLGRLQSMASFTR